jgi:hypothetical protein
MTDQAPDAGFDTRLFRDESQDFDIGFLAAFTRMGLQIGVYMPAIYCAVHQVTVFGTFDVFTLVRDIVFLAYTRLAAFTVRMTSTFGLVL